MVMTPSELQQIYQESGLSKRAFASAIGVSDTAVRGWLTGESISPENEKRIRAFGAQTPPPTDFPSLLAPPREERTIAPASAPAPSMPLQTPIFDLPLADNLIARSDQHTLSLGIGRSGKSTYAAEQLRFRPRFVVLAPADDFAMDGVPEHVVQTVKDVGFAHEQQIIRIQVASVEAERLLWDAIIDAALTTGDIHIYIDELSQVCKRSHMPDALYRALRYGRHRGVSIYAVTQRPIGIPSV